MAENSKLSILTKGIIKENPVLRLVLGTCPTLAVTTAASNGIGMGIAATLVLIGSNVAISLLRKVIPDKVRIPAYITIIAAFVTIIQMLVNRFCSFSLQLRQKKAGTVTVPAFVKEIVYVLLY